MPLDLLSSIKGASSSEAVEELFSIINDAAAENQDSQMAQAESQELVSLESLRSDEVKQRPEQEITLIKKNFPKEKEGYLVVPKVIED